MKSLYQKIKETYANKYLFKRDINGKVIYWSCNVSCNNNVFQLYTYYGQLKSGFADDFPKAISEPINGVNQGKSNATTNEEQAYKQLESEYKNHIKKGYKEYLNIPELNVEAIDAIVSKQNTGIEDMVQPMKFKPFEIGKCKYPMIGQPKYNGVRCMALKSLSGNSLFDSYPTSFLSKELTEYSAEHLNEQIHKIIDKIKEIVSFDSIILDGELYIYNVPAPTIAGAARNTKNKYSTLLQYVIYDLAIDNISQLDRLQILHLAMQGNLLIHRNDLVSPQVYLSSQRVINNDEEALEYLDECLAWGYEGCVLRPYNEEYAFGQRPSFNRKLKRFIDAEFEILDIVEYGNRDNKVGYGCKFICRNDITSGIFECVPKGDYEQRLEYVVNKDNYIGQQATVKFYERTINKLPFHGNVIAIRNYE